MLRFLRVDLLLVKLVFVCAMLCTSPSILAANAITAARVWPAQDYTRVTLEANAPFKYQLLVLKNPDRLVLDIEDAELNNALKALTDKILSSDPYIKQVRAAKFKANVVRIVIDLKTEVKSNLFALLPAGDYKHRLVLDIYPLQDPLMAMLDKRDIDKRENADKVDSNQPKPLEPKPIVEPLPPNSDVPDETVLTLPPENKTPEIKVEQNIAKSVVASCHACRNILLASSGLPFSSRFMPSRQRLTILLFGLNSIFKFVFC